MMPFTMCSFQPWKVEIIFTVLILRKHTRRIHVEWLMCKYIQAAMKTEIKSNIHFQYQQCQ